MTEKRYDPEETREETAARVIDKASEQYADRCGLFIKTLRNNGRHLTPYKRQLTAAWLKKHHDRMLAALDEGDEIPPLGLDGLPDYHQGTS